MKILLVEDNPDDALLIEEMMRSFGDSFTLDWKKNIKEAHESLSSESYDIALVDLSLPDSQGIETVRNFQSFGIKIPVVVLTGLSDDKTAVQAIQQGAQDYLVKDRLNSDTLIRSIEYAKKRFLLLMELEDLVEERTAALKSSEERYRKLVESFPGGCVFLYSEEGIVSVAGGELLRPLGVDAKKVKGLNLTVLLDLNSQTQSRMDEIIASPFRGRRSEGEWEKNGMVISVQNIPVEMEHNRIYGMLIMQDISAARNAEKALLINLKHEKDLNGIRAKLVTTLSHEFRTPLTSILISAQILNGYRNQIESEKLELHYRKIEKAVSSLTEMLDDAMLLNENRKDGSVPDRIEIEPFLKQIISSFPRNFSQEIILENCCFRSVFWLQADYLRQIVHNLLSNAFKYSGESGVVCIRVSENDMHLILSVEDNGIGVDPEEIPAIFDLFRRGSNADTVPGTGMGLTIVQRAVEMLNGRLDFESNPGKGTKCTVRIPYTVSPEQTSGKYEI